MIFADRKLAQKIERAEGAANAEFVETRARLRPDSGAQWKEIAGVFAMFDGVESPCTQTFGLGIFDEATDELLDEIEQFFISKNAPVVHEVSPMADPEILPLLNGRGYKPVELSTLLYREIDQLAFSPQRNRTSKRESYRRPKPRSGPRPLRPVG